MSKKPAPSKVMQESREAQEFRDRLSADRTTVRCPYCEEPHGLWYRVGAGGKRSLMYTCNKVKHYWWTQEVDCEPVEHFRLVTKSFQAPEMIEGLPIRDEWTPGHKEAVAKKAQHQLPLMK